MDAFGDNFDQTEVDPAADFLAREKDQLAGLEDELNEPAVSAVSNVAMGKQATDIDLHFYRTYEHNMNTKADDNICKMGVYSMIKFMFLWKCVIVRCYFYIFSLMFCVFSAA